MVFNNLLTTLRPPSSALQQWLPLIPCLACAQDEREGGGQALHMNLLQALLCAGMHSRAAYGYAMAAGHLSSLLNFALLQTVGCLVPSVVFCRSMLICKSWAGRKGCAAT